MRISDWSSDVCSSDLSPLLGRHRQGHRPRLAAGAIARRGPRGHRRLVPGPRVVVAPAQERAVRVLVTGADGQLGHDLVRSCREAGDEVLACGRAALDLRSEEHTSELQSLMRISYAVFCF